MTYLGLLAELQTLSQEVWVGPESLHFGWASEQCQTCALHHTWICRGLGILGGEKETCWKGEIIKVLKSKQACFTLLQRPELGPVGASSGFYLRKHFLVTNYTHRIMAVAASESGAGHIRRSLNWTKGWTFPAWKMVMVISSSLVLLVNNDKTKREYESGKTDWISHRYKA